MCSDNLRQSLLENLRHDVQHNCHIADARHGAEYGLCTYLMKMREYFRWETGRGFSDSLDKDEVGDWLTARENLWASLGESDYSPIRLNGCQYDPFDDLSINRELSDYGLVYSGGMGTTGRPHFFLGELVRRERLPEYALYVSGSELARDLAAPPAMTRGGSIFIRRESVRRMLWEKYETWNWARPDNALGRAFACYDFEEDSDQALEAMTDNELDFVLLHEQGECQAGERLNSDWNDMLLAVTRTPAELLARAVRDHLADCLVTLPALAEMDREASLHFYFGNLSAMRKELFPALGLAYDGWLKTRDFNQILAVAAQGEGHWMDVADRIMALFRTGGSDQGQRISELTETCRL
ncbi:MAG: hypothetical protein GY703_10365 [Gammaproteobacteria bacterium]|nr:hypothetical protein [Gammaproteobacteria bacterium]